MAVEVDDFTKHFEEAIDEPGKTAEVKDDGKSEKAETRGETEEAGEAQPTDGGSESKGDEDKTEVKEGFVPEHTHKSLQGMYNSEIKKRQQLEKQLAELQEKSKEFQAEAEDQKPTDQEKPAPARPSAADIKEALMKNPKLKSWVEEFPDVADGVLEIAQELEGTLKERMELMAQTLTPILQRDAITAEEAHFAAIHKAHRDFDEIMKEGALKNWITELPPYKQESYMKAYQSGSAEEVIDMVHDFKNAKGIKTSSGSQKNEEEELGDLDISVKSKRTPVSTRKGKGAEGFEETFNEITR